MKYMFNNSKGVSMKLSNGMLFIGAIFFVGMISAAQPGTQRMYQQPPMAQQQRGEFQQTTYQTEQTESSMEAPAHQQFILVKNKLNNEPVYIKFGEQPNIPWAEIMSNSEKN